MKIAITGHTRGLGKALLDCFLSNNHEVIGFSQSTGFDISDPKDRKSICESVFDCDVFINNAFHMTGQYEMLNDIINMWSKESKLLINISSKATSANLDGMPDSDFKTYMIDYADSKKKQDELLEKRKHYPYPRIVNVIPGIIDTDMAKVLKSDKMNPNDVAELIHHIISLKNTLLIQEVKIDVPSLNFRNIEL